MSSYRQSESPIAEQGVAMPFLTSPLAPQSGAHPIVMDCVLREVSYKDFEYVPVSEVPYLIPGETIFHGAFKTQVESHGPSGSHRRTICLPVGGLNRRKAPGKRNQRGTKLPARV